MDVKRENSRQNKEEESTMRGQGVHDDLKKKMNEVTGYRSICSLSLPVYLTLLYSLNIART